MTIACMARWHGLPSPIKQLGCTARLEQRISPLQLFIVHLVLSELRTPIPDSIIRSHHTS